MRCLSDSVILNCQILRVIDRLLFLDRTSTTISLARILENDPIPDVDHLRLLKRYLHILPSDQVEKVSFFLPALIKVSHFG
jgi:hypothetical protein